jgi:hypothetical protein
MKPPADQSQRIVLAFHGRKRLQTTWLFEHLGLTGPAIARAAN